MASTKMTECTIRAVSSLSELNSIATDDSLKARKVTVNLKKSYAVLKMKYVTPLLPQQKRLSCLLSLEKASLPGFAFLEIYLASLLTSAFSLCFRKAIFSSSLCNYSFSVSFRSVFLLSNFR